MDFERIVTSHVKGLRPYQSARRIGGHGHTFLNANESPKSELYMFNSTTLNRYPDCQPHEVLEGFADYAGVRPNQVIIGRGSDEIIGLLVRTFCSFGEDGIVIAPPTYGVYEVMARANGAKVAIAKRGADLAPSAEGIIAAAQGAPFPVRLVFIDSPANPLGMTFPRADLERVLTALPETLVVLDEAYIEYCPEQDQTALIATYPNLVVTRTLSKAFALAGIRCGFGVARPEIIAAMLKVIDPYPVPDPVAQIARQALASGGLSLMKIRVAQALKRRATLEAALLSLPIVERVYPSEANFLLARFKDGQAVFDALLQKGVVLRAFMDKPGLENCVRISIGSDEELDEAMRLLSDFAEGK
ncbi:MAG: histidinol-phosphate transaminase [Succinivibrionaceae bacterium]|nr:histidinol-phosphate transaminase [Succinivibrionaceae bacterium]